MPEMDGYETAAHIKSRPRTQDIPIIFLTAIDREAHQAYRGYAAGAVDFLAKPFDPWVLRAKVEVFVGLQQERRRLLDRTADLERRLEAVSGAKLDQALERIERLIVMAGDDATSGGRSPRQSRRCASCARTSSRRSPHPTPPALAPPSCQTLGAIAPQV